LLLCRRINQLWREADHWRPWIAGAKYEWSCTSVHSPICLRCAHRNFVFFITFIVMVGIFIVLGLHILDVMAYWRCAVESYFSEGTILLIIRLDAFPYQ
jgi:hypothetical protein